MDGWRDWFRAAVARLRRVERREFRSLRRWLEHTGNLIHLSIVAVLPVLLGVVTALANAVEYLPYLLYPPLASGAYTLFADPEGRYASPRRFVGGLTAGAFCGWLALVVAARYWYRVPSEAFAVDPGAVALGVFLTGAVTWALDVEEASAFSTALLIHVTGTSQLTYVLSVAVSSTLVAGVFLAWRRQFYERRGQYLYATTMADDHVLVPMRAADADATTMLAARLAAANDAGKVVLLDLVADEEVAAAERGLLNGSGAAADGGSSGATDRDGGIGGKREAAGGDASTPGPAVREAGGAVENPAVDAAVTRLEERARRIETGVGVPCDVVVAVEDRVPATTVLRVARETNCDLVAAAEDHDGGLSPFARGLLGGDVDALIHRSRSGRTEWPRVVVSVRRPGEIAHAMIDFATRIAGTGGHVTVCHCIGHGGDLRDAERMLADLVETFEGSIGTRVAREPVESFLADAAPAYDLAVLGASRDRTAASRLFSPPTFERIEDLECDVAIVDRRH